MPRWNELLRYLNLPRSSFFDEGEPLAVQMGAKLEERTIETLRRVTLGACLAAQEALSSARACGTAPLEDGACVRETSRGALPALPAPRESLESVALIVEADAGASRPMPPNAQQTGATAERVTPARPPLVLVDPDTAARGFERAMQERRADRALFDVFRPTALLYEATARPRDHALVGLRDSVSQSPQMKGLTAVGDYVRRGRYRVLGDLFFVPQAKRGEARERSRWLRASALDPPRWDERGGPFWRLGRFNMWRVDVLGWHERLALAALVGTTCTEAVLLGPPKLFPRIGFVAEVARCLGRTLVGVPLDSCPERLVEEIHDMRVRAMPRDASFIMRFLEDF
ncbi:MAG: hypothetical protein JSW67_14930 [Candidatus Latescibacterota bacterium]|nr:MAG: hypothetical protein JSW67_14930 [Candidatus Latescibacterota bacterium]